MKKAPASSSKGKVSFKQVSGFDVQLRGRTGKPSGEPVPVELPYVAQKKGGSKRKDYLLYFELRDRAHSMNKLRFQRHVRKGGLTFNWINGNRFSYAVADDSDRAKLLAVSIMTLSRNEGIIIITHLRELAKTSPFFSSVMLHFDEMQRKVKESRKALRHSKHRL